MGNKILITGASGFTGRHFISLANSLGYECIALSQKQSDSVVGCTQVIVADLKDKTQLKEKLLAVSPNYVVHLAGISFVAHGDVGEIYKTNTIGTLNLLDSLIELNLPLKKVLIASSGNVYGNNKELPINEGMSPAPVNDYAISKYAMELAAQLRFKKLPLLIVRPFNYTGVGQSEHFLIPKIVKAFKLNQPTIELGNLDVARDFSDVRDVVNSYVKLLESDSSSEQFNICTGKSTTLLSIISTLNQLADYEIKVDVNPSFVRDDEIKELYGDNHKLINAIGSYSSYVLEDTLKWMFESK